MTALEAIIMRGVASRSETTVAILEAMDVHVAAKEVLEDCLTCLAVMVERTRIKRQIAKHKGPRGVQAVSSCGSAQCVVY